MDKKEELIQKIASITTRIQQEHPELLKYLNEQPNTVPNYNKQKSDIFTLENYYNSLKELIEKHDKAAKEAQQEK